jgi:hypothetical protein
MSDTIIANTLIANYGVEVVDCDGSVCCFIFYRTLNGPEYSASLSCAEDNGLENDRGETKLVPDRVLTAAYRFAEKHGY